MKEIEAIDLFVEKDPESDEDGEANSLISLRVPTDREFSRQIKELGAKWDDAAKEWRLVGNEATVKQIGGLCKSVFPTLPRRRNRVVSAQVATEEDYSRSNNGEKESELNPPSEPEVTVRVEFLVNRNIKNYRRGQNLKWVKVFREVQEQKTLSETGAKAGSGNPGGTSNNAAGSSEGQGRYVNQLQGKIRELEQAAAEAFEALLVGQKEAVAMILKEAGIEQV